MPLWATVTDYIKGKFNGGSKTVAQAKVRARNNPYSTLLTLGPGIEVNPAKGEYLVIEKIDGESSFRVAIGGLNNNIEPDTARGERRFYSVSEAGTSIAAVIKLDNAGNIELNGNADFAVAFNALKAAFDELKNDFNSLVSDYTGHGHPFTGVPSGSPGTTGPSDTPGTPSSADIDPAKVETVKLP